MPAKPPDRAAPEGPANPAAPTGPQLDDWNLLRSFIAVFETGTLTEAARRLGTTQPSVGRHVRELEGLLGEALFQRLPGRLRPTPRAEALHAVVAPMKVAAVDARRLFADGAQRLSGTVRVAASEVYAVHVVAPILAALLAEHPALEVELSASNRADNLLRRDADIAVRFFRPDQDDVIAVQVGTTELGLYAHASYLARHGEPTGFELPEGGFVAGFDREAVPLAALMRGPLPAAPVHFRFRSDAILTRYAAVESGWAVGVYLRDVADERPGLQRILADRFGAVQPVWLCAHPELRRSASMRAVWDRLEQALRARLNRAAGPGAPAAAGPRSPRAAPGG